MLSKEQKEQIINLYQSGLSQRQIAQKFNVCTATIGNVTRNAGVSFKHIRHRETR